jgi:phage recombination protein Bet
MTTLAKPDERPIDLELIKRTVAKGATDDELALYLHDCQRRGVHPLDRMLHFTLRADKGGRKYTPIVSIDLLRSRAAATGELAGMEDTAFATDPDNGHPDTATVTVYRMVQGQRCPTTKTARWFEYKPAKEDFMWVKMPYTMLGKCAEALALRAAFPAELSGLYTADEMAQSPAVDPNMTVEANRLPPAEQQAAREAHPQNYEPYATKEQLAALTLLRHELRLDNKKVNEDLRRHGFGPDRKLKASQAGALLLEYSQERVAELLSQLKLTVYDLPNIDKDIVVEDVEKMTQPQCNLALNVLRMKLAVPADKEAV